MKGRGAIWLHYGFTAFFFVQIPVALLTGLKSSLPYLVFLSLWALVASHLSAAEAAKADYHAKTDLEVDIERKVP